MNTSPGSLTSLHTEVLQYLHDHSRDIVADLSSLVRVPSISGSDEENSIVDVLAQRFSRWDIEVDHWAIPLAATIAAVDFPGSEVDRTEAWGLVGKIAGRSGGRSLMLNNHVDVVPPGNLAAWPHDDAFDGAVDADRVYGRGACDMKGGLAASLWAVRALIELKVPLQGDLLLACVVGEEDGGLGTFATLQRGWTADACVIPEPTSLDLVPANGGALTFRLTVPGLAVHASRRSAGVSAVEKFLPIFAALRTLEAERNAQVDPMMARWDIAYPIEIGSVHAGDWTSTVPDLLVAEGRYGVCLDETPEAARSAFERAVHAASGADPWLRDHPVEITWWGGQFASCRARDADSMLDAVARAHGAVAQHSLAAVAGSTAAVGGNAGSGTISRRAQQSWGAPYGSDLRLMTNIAGIPTVQYGPGDVTLAHGPGESVPIDEVITAAQTLAVLAMDHCGVE